MGPFFEAIFAPTNLWLTVLLGLCGVYWLIVVVGGISADALDVDLEVGGGDLDPGLDAGPGGAAGGGAEFDAVGDGAASGAQTSVAEVGVSTAVLRFFNLGDVPLMVVLTVLAFVMWAISVGLYPVTRDWTPLLQVALLVAAFAVATLVMKAVTWPLKRLFRAMREEERRADLQLIGKVCRVTSSRVTGTTGQAEFSTGGAPLLLNVRTRHEDALARGDEAVIVEQDERAGVYYVRGF